MLKLAGYWLIFTSILHFIGGFVFFPDPLAEIAQAGWWNAVSPAPFNLNYEREAAFWFMMISPLLFILGMLCCWIEDPHFSQKARSISKNQSKVLGCRGRESGKLIAKSF